LPRVYNRLGFARHEGVLVSEFERPELRGTRVLVVDDDADNREMLAMILEYSGALVATADSAAEAMCVLERERSQVLISDIGLPDEDGFSLLRRVRALPASRGGNIPAIALTGHGTREDRAQTLGEGFQAHLTKPIALDEMLTALVRVLQASPDCSGG
jgi:CheY-like chemotaxis protein